MSSPTLDTLLTAFQKTHDPRDPRGIRHDYHGVLVLVFLGLLARLPYISHIQRWATRYWRTLKEPLGFTRNKPPVDTTISRILAKTTLQELQDALAEFLNVLLSEEYGELTASVDGKTAKQSRDKNGNPIHLLNVFAHHVKVTLNQWSVTDDKTNEPNCLKTNLPKLFEQYPMLRLLTGDAIFAQRPLLEVLKEHGCDYLFQLKANQGDAFEAVEHCFKEAPTKKPDAVSYSKKKGTSSNEYFGATSTLPTIFGTR
jgi:hypothetical protein